MRALRSTHQTLLDWNRRSLAREQVGIGVSAVIVRGSAVYLAQVGPTLVYHWGGGTLRRLDAEPECAEPLGEGDLEPLVRRFDLEPGDVLLAASQELDERVGTERLQALLARGSEHALPELYLLTKDLPVFALFAVAGIDGGGEAGPGLAKASTDGFEPAADAFPQQLPSVPAQPPVARIVPISAPGQPAPAAVEPELPPSPRPLDISRPVVQLRRDPGGTRGSYPRTTGEGGLRLSIEPSRALAFGAAVLLVLFLAVYAVPDLVRENRDVKAATLMDRAGVVLAQAQTATDPGQKRELLGEARRLSGEAARIQPESPEASDLHTRATAALQALDAVARVEPATVATLSQQVTGEVSVDRIVVGLGSAFLLDTRGRRVLAVPLTGSSTPSPVYEDGASYAGVTGRAPQFIALDATGGRVLVLDSERKLFELKPGAPARALALRGSGSWSSAGDIASHDGNLYILDQRANQVLRYAPGAAGFEADPVTVLSGGADLSKATALVVDSEVYVLASDGRVHRFSDGGEAGFSLAGIDRGLLAPSSAALLPSAGEIFVADAGNKRVVVADSTGAFKRQLVSSAFTDLRAIALDPGTAQLYVMAGDAVLNVPLAN